MDIAVLTLFPEQIKANLGLSITGRAQEKGLYHLNCFNPRKYPVNRYGKVDDSLAGGGTGLLLRCEPLQASLQEAESWLDAQYVKSEGSSRDHTSGIRRIFLSPKGARLTQDRVRSFAQEEQLLLLCGHYEGVDQRFLECNHFEELSIGDFVLTGGELAACVFLDAVLRLIPGVLPCSEAYENESHSSGLLEECQYTKPASWAGLRVPEVLLSGDHARIEAWKKQSALLETFRKRPDLLNQKILQEEEWLQLIQSVRTGKTRDS